MAGVRARYNNAAGHQAALASYNGGHNINHKSQKKNIGGGGDAKVQQHQQQQNPSRAGQKTVLYPGTVKQLMSATADPRLPGRMRMDGLLLTEVTIVGQVKSVDDHDLSCLSFVLSDGTGDITVRSQRGMDSSSDDPHVQPNNIVRVFGSLRPSSSGSLLGSTPAASLTAFVIRPATEAEYEFHTLESEFVRRHMNGSLPATTTPTAVVSTAAPSAHSEVKTSDINPAAAAADEKKENVTSPAAMDSELEKQVIKSLESGRESDIGMTLEEICSGISSSCNAAGVRAMITHLQSLGILYHTIDDLHFKLS